MWRFAIVVTALIASGRGALAQVPATATPTLAPQAAFVGFIKNSLDSGGVRSADLRLYFIDSTREITEPLGGKAIETFVDTVRSRLAVSDSAGYFAVWRLAPGRYVMTVRRMGFYPMEGMITVDSGTVYYDFAMKPIPSLLAKVEIHEGATTLLGSRLDRVGFLRRKKFNAISGTFVTPGDIAKFKPETLRDILSHYGVFESNADIEFDRMPLAYYDVQDYPASEIAGVEIYRHGRPVDFNATRRGPGLMQPGGASFVRRALVVIWSY